MLDFPDLVSGPRLCRLERVQRDPRLRGFVPHLSEAVVELGVWTFLWRGPDDPDPVLRARSFELLTDEDRQLIRIGMVTLRLLKILVVPSLEDCP